MLKFQLPVTVDKVKHEVSSLARMGLDSDYYDNAHMNVQMFMLSFDNKTIAIEIPLWLTCEELEGFKELFGSEMALSGHIDLIRIEEGKIWIWDYKPKASREKYAVTQTYFYALMLSKRTNISLDNFMCGYFDDIDVYVFKPSEINLEVLKENM
ncbi:MAG: PD-(D/E)XK nuclease family protein [Candidatus Nanoarchaeia archaeon]